MRKVLWTLLMLVWFANWSFAEESKDRLGEVLSLVGFTREDLGYRARGYWTRFMHPKHIPYTLYFFEDLLAEPMQTYDFTKTMALAARDYLSPAYLSEKQDGLFKLAHFVGVNRKLVGFRGYNADLAYEVDDQAPMMHAFEQIYASAHRAMRYITWDGKVAKWPNYKADIQAQLEGLDLKLQKPIAALMLAMLDAYQWRQRAVRNVPAEKMQIVFNYRDLSETHSDGRLYCPEIDDVACYLDEHALYFGCLKAVQGADTARRMLLSVVQDSKMDLKPVHFSFRTPIGRVVIAGTGNDTHTYDDCALLIDLGGDDTYNGPIGATPSLNIPVAVAIDLDGKDTYLCDTEAYPSQGGAILGVGVLVDVAGDDRYQAKRYAQGLGVFGLGFLFDGAGDDRYTLDLSGQGCGYFGVWASRGYSWQRSLLSVG